MEGIPGLYAMGDLSARGWGFRVGRRHKGKSIAICGNPTWD